MKRAMAYIRVSGKGQSHKEGPKIQMQLIEEYAKQHNFEIIEFFQDIFTARMLYRLEKKWIGLLYNNHSET